MLGFVTWSQGDFRGARALIEESLVLVRALGSEPHITAAFLCLNCLPLDDDTPGPANISSRGTIVLLRDLSAPAVEAYVLANLGNLACAEGRHEQARALLEESLGRFRGLGDRLGITQVLGYLGSLATFTGDYVRARVLLEESRALRRQIGRNRDYAHSLMDLANLAVAEGDLTQARDYYEQSLELLRELRDAPAIGWSSPYLGYIAVKEGDYARARSVYAELPAVYSVHGATRQGQAMAPAYLGAVARLEGDHAAARAHLEEALVHWRAVGDRRSCAALLHDLGEENQALGDLPAARASFLESLGLSRDLGDGVGVARALLALASLAAAQGRPEPAARLLGALAAHRGATATVLPRRTQPIQATVQAEVRAALGEAAFTAAMSAGSAYSLDEAIALAAGPETAE
jgi:tetratricopeptide (TPR) repeat protein